jgi:hypothetical protein
VHLEVVMARDYGVFTHDLMVQDVALLVRMESVYRLLLGLEEVVVALV